MVVAAGGDGAVAAGWQGGLDARRTGKPFLLGVPGALGASHSRVHDGAPHVVIMRSGVARLPWMRC